MINTVHWQAALDRAVHSGSNFSMSVGQYLFIAQKLAAKNVNFLVFGVGYDADLWLNCCPSGKLAFVENDPDWIPDVLCNVVQPRYRGRVGQWLKRTPVPAALKRAWDFVLVDGPTGFSPECVGRQEPIAWAAKIGKTVFVHDYDRPWERKLSDHYLGTPDEIVPFDGHRRERSLAVFYRDAAF